MLRLVIAGSRNFDDYDLLESTLNEFIEFHSIGDPDPGVLIISGLAKGADLLGVQYANQKGYKVEEFPANWKLGRSAGPKRNLEMAKSANSCIVFWDGVSKGTANMIELAKRFQLKLLVINFGTGEV
jgi:hypothetical protein